MSRSELSISRWLDAHSDRSAGLNSLPNTVLLADIAGDGDHRLVVADIKLEKDMRSRLKVYKGTLLTTDQTLPDIPSALISFYINTIDSKFPAIGIACGMELLIYKNNKPFHKFTVPSLPILPLEVDIWGKLAEHPNDGGVAALLDELRQIPSVALTPRSHTLLGLEPFKRADFIRTFGGRELKRQSPITCATVINKSSTEWRATACPIIATECGQIYFIDPITYTVLHQASVWSGKATPTTMRAAGLFDVEFRLVIATREGYICLLRREWLEGKVLTQTTAPIVDMVLIPGDHFILVATADKKIVSYTKRGNKLWSLEMKTYVTCLCLMPLKHLSTHLLCVGLHGGAIELYQGRNIVDRLAAPDTPSAILFGQMGQEEHVLINITTGGILDLKILKRTADFNLSQHDNNLIAAVHNKPLPIPKRSKLFLEQSARERQNAVEMHRNFQQDLIRLRLTAARALVQIQSDQSGIGNEKEMIKLTAQILGLGPKFRLILNLENMNAEKALTNLSVVFHCRPTYYKLSDYSIRLPLIPPGLTYKAETRVQELNFEEHIQAMATGATQNIKVFCMRDEQVQPVLSATINMPLTDVTVPLL